MRLGSTWAAGMSRHPLSEVSRNIWLPPLLPDVVVGQRKPFDAAQELPFLPGFSASLPVDAGTFGWEQGMAREWCTDLLLLL